MPWLCAFLAAAIGVTLVIVALLAGSENALAISLFFNGACYAFIACGMWIEHRNRK
jgi:hypothetical protein